MDNFALCISQWLFYPLRNAEGKQITFSNTVCTRVETCSNKSPGYFKSQKHSSNSTDQGCDPNLQEDQTLVGKYHCWMDVKRVKDSLFSILRGTSQEEETCLGFLPIYQLLGSAEHTSYSTTSYRSSRVHVAQFCWGGV